MIHMKNILRARIMFVGLVTVIFSIFTVNEAFSGELMVSAAASLSPPFKEIITLYEKEKGQKLVVNFGASGTLVKQIQEGAPVDVFISADEKRMNQLDAGGLLLKGTRQDILKNALVLVVSADSKVMVKSAKDLIQPDITKIAIGVPGIVPAGDYAKQFLIREKLWDTVSPLLVPQENVRAVLATVESGDAQAGFVYQSDALSSGKVKVAFNVPDSGGLVIVYPAAVLKSSEHIESARELMEFLKSDVCQDIFKKFGFIPLL